MKSSKCYFKDQEAFEFLEDFEKFNSDKSEQYGLVGSDIAHSLSPLIHRAGATLAGRSVRYLLFDIAPNKLDSFLSLAFRVGVSGLNLTAPMKSRAASLLGSPKLVVNTLKRSGGYWQAEMTDIRGLDLFLALQGISLFSSGQWVILGSGDIATSLVFNLNHSQSSKVKKVTILTREHKDLAPWMSRKGLPPLCFDLSIANYQSYFKSNLSHLYEPTSIAFVASSGPLLTQYFAGAGYDLQTWLKPFPGSLVDLNYGRSRIFQGPVLREGPTFDGLGMLIEQARLAQEIWFKKSLDPHLYRQAVYDRLLKGTET